MFPTTSPQPTPEERLIRALEEAAHRPPPDPPDAEEHGLDGENHDEEDPPDDDGPGIVERVRTIAYGRRGMTPIGRPRPRPLGGISVPRW